MESDRNEDVIFYSFFQMFSRKKGLNKASKIKNLILASYFSECMNNSLQISKFYIK